MNARLKVSSAVAMVLGLAACGQLPGPPGPAPAAIAPADPLRAACADFHSLQEKELGARQVAAPRELAPWNARELFRRAEAFGYSGGYRFAANGAVSVSDGYGMADRAAGVAITPETIFDIGSVAKQFTAAAILRLEEMGRLRTSDPVSAHFAAVPPDKQAVTIHHLLTHSSGLPHDVGEVMTRPNRDEAVRDILAAPLQTAPGEKYAYSNAGYALLAAIVERASGRDYETFLRSELWLPAGMSEPG